MRYIPMIFSNIRWSDWFEFRNVPSEYRFLPIIRTWYFYHNGYGTKNLNGHPVRMPRNDAQSMLISIEYDDWIEWRILPLRCGTESNRIGWRNGWRQGKKSGCTRAVMMGVDGWSSGTHPFATNRIHSESVEFGTSWLWTILDISFPYYI